MAEQSKLTEEEIDMQAKPGNHQPAATAAPPVSRHPECLYQIATVLAVLLLLWSAAA